MGSVVEQKAASLEGRLNAMLLDKDKQIDSLAKINDIVVCRKEADELRAAVAQQKKYLDNYRENFMPDAMGFLFLLAGVLIGICLVICLGWTLGKQAE